MRPALHYWQNGYKRVRGWTKKRSLPVENFVGFPAHQYCALNILVHGNSKILWFGLRPSRCFFFYLKKPDHSPYHSLSCQSWVYFIISDHSLSSGRCYILLKSNKDFLGKIRTEVDSSSILYICLTKKWTAKSTNLEENAGNIKLVFVIGAALWAEKLSGRCLKNYRSWKNTLGKLVVAVNLEAICDSSFEWKERKWRWDFCLLWLVILKSAWYSVGDTF